MTDRDTAAAEHYELEENRRIAGPAHKRGASQKRLSNHVPVRFDAALISHVRHLADEDGLTVSSWIRAVVEREVKSRLARQSSTGFAALVAFEERPRQSQDATSTAGVAPIMPLHPVAATG